MLGAERTAESYVRKSEKELIAELQALHNELSLLKKNGGGRNQDGADSAEGEPPFRELIEGSIAGVMIHRTDAVLYVNSAFAEMLGYTVDEVFGFASAITIIAPEDRARLRKYSRARLKGEDAPRRYEFRGLCKDGSRIWIENLVRTINWEGKPAVYVSAREITERKQAEEALRESEQRNAAMLQAIPDMIFRLDAKGIYLDFVRAAHFDPVTPPETFMGKRMDEVLPAEVAQAGRQKNRRGPDDGQGADLGVRP